MLGAMKIEQITVGAFAVNCSVIWGEAGQALIIDPGSDAGEIEAVLRRNGVQVAGYLLTHGHADHIDALAGLHAAHPAPVYMHPADAEWAFGPDNQIPPYYPVPSKPDTGILNPADSKDWKKAGPVFQTPEENNVPQCICLETPGHTPGGVCYWFKEAGICFTGDTLFKGACGRTDLPGGDARTLTNSLGKLAHTLPPDTQIIAGHGERSTMKQEMATNFFLQRFKGTPRA
jgi:hydroxyacylglutathione hydrolase